MRLQLAKPAGVDRAVDRLGADAVGPDEVAAGGDVRGAGVSVIQPWACSRSMRVEVAQASPIIDPWMALSAPTPEALTISRFREAVAHLVIDDVRDVAAVHVTPVNRYICMRGALPSGGVEKLALLRPWPSLTSVRM